MGRVRIVSAASLLDDDSGELAALLGFLADWIATDPDTLGPSMHRFTFGLFGLDEIRGDLSRFAWALGADVSIPDDTDNDHEDDTW
jgi:hypothetical protein